MPEKSRGLVLLVRGTDLFAGTEKGVFLSSDNGAHWAPVNSGLPADTPVSCLALSGPNLFAGTAKGVFLSTDNGANWAAINSGLAFTDVECLAVCGTGLYAGISGYGVWRFPLSEILIDKK